MASDGDRLCVLMAALAIVTAAASVAGGGGGRKRERFAGRRDRVAEICAEGDTTKDKSFVGTLSSPAGTYKTQPVVGDLPARVRACHGRCRSDPTCRGWSLVRKGSMWDCRQFRSDALELHDSTDQEEEVSEMKVEACAERVREQKACSGLSANAVPRPEATSMPTMALFRNTRPCLSKFQVVDAFPQNGRPLYAVLRDVMRRTLTYARANQIVLLSYNRVDRVVLLHNVDARADADEGGLFSRLRVYNPYQEAPPGMNFVLDNNTGTLTKAAADRDGRRKHIVPTVIRPPQPGEVSPLQEADGRYEPPLNDRFMKLIDLPHLPVHPDVPDRIVWPAGQQSVSDFYEDKEYDTYIAQPSRRTSLFQTKPVMTQRKIYPDQWYTSEGYKLHSTTRRERGDPRDEEGASTLSQQEQDRLKEEMTETRAYDNMFSEEQLVKHCTVVCKNHVDQYLFGRLERTCTGFEVNAEQDPQDGRRTCKFFWEWAGNDVEVAIDPSKNYYHIPRTTSEMLDGNEWQQNRWKTWNNAPRR
jgi:hypothetical protein